MTSLEPTARQSQDTNQLAVFLDLDNIEIESKKKMNQHLDPILLKNKCMELGKIRFLTAYADFTESAGQPLRIKLAQEGYEINDLPSLGIHSKNSADIQIVVDALTLAYEIRDIDTFVLITGDADFNPLTKKLRRSGKRIIVIGLDSSTAISLKKNCDQFIAYEDIIKIKEAIPYDQFINMKDEKTYDQEIQKMVQSLSNSSIPYLEEFLRAVRVTEEKSGYIMVSHLKEIMLQLDPSFNEIKFGKKSYIEFLKIYENANIIEIKKENTSHYVEMRKLTLEDWTKILKGQLSN